jgi:hypothetical protein
MVGPSSMISISRSCRVEALRSFSSAELQTPSAEDIATRKLGAGSMIDPPPLSQKALRKRARRTANDRLAKEARFWDTPRTAEQTGSRRPINRQAAKELSGDRKGRAN